MEWNDRVVMDLSDDRRCLISFSRRRLDKCRKLSSWTRLHSIYFCNWVVIGTPVWEGGTRIEHLDVGALTSAIKNQSTRCRSRLQAIIAFRRWEYVEKLFDGMQEKTGFDHDFIAFSMTDELKLQTQTCNLHQKTLQQNWVTLIWFFRWPWGIDTVPG